MVLYFNPISFDEITVSISEDCGLFLHSMISSKDSFINCVTNLCYKTILFWLNKYTHLNDNNLE